MYGKPILSIWGDPFAADRPLENMGVRHQGIAASLMPANPYACHNYSLQLAEVGRKEESYRWADRATVAGPDFGAAHLDCVRRLRQVGRPGQAFAGAQYRGREILDRAGAGKLPPNDWQAPHHAALLIAFVHLDIGRIADATELADDALAQLPADPATKEAFAWALKRISHWKSDAGLLARAYAWEGYHRGDPGRAVVGLTRGRITDDEDALIMIDALLTIGREDQAELAVHHCTGVDDDSLAAADALAQEWWTALVPPAKDRDAHAAGAVLALGVALVQYIAEASVPPTPIAGAYRHIATEALHLVRRSRYQIEPAAIRALLALVERLGAAPEWLLDTWLLPIERAFDLEAEHGAYLDNFLAGLPIVSRLLRGDERVGWELRMAHDLAVDRSQFEPAARLFERCSRAIEAGGVALAWSVAAARTAPAKELLDIHWIAPLANPTGVAAPWLQVAAGLMTSGKPNDGFAAACRGMIAATAKERGQAVADLMGPWRLAGITTPLDGDQAFEAGLVAASNGDLDVAIQHLRWAAAAEPGNAKRAQSLTVALGRAGSSYEALRTLAPHERMEAPRLVGRVLVEAGRNVEAV